MSPNSRDEEESRLRADLIEEERELRPLRDRISEAERSFDLQLEALDRKSEVQDISHVINFHNQTSENIRKELENLSTALEENEQRLREAVAEANRLNLSIEEAKEKVEGDRMISMAPLYDNLFRVKAELRLERNAGVQESRQASLAMNKTIDNASPLLTERPGKLPRRGSFGSRNVSDVPEEDRMITARSRNRDSSKMPPLLSPLLLDPAYENAIQTDVSAARIKREGSKAITSGGDVLFDLYFINCGKKEYGEDAPSLKFDVASGDILPLHPISGDLSAKFPELVIRAPSLDQVMFATGKDVGDIVKLKYKVGEGSKTQLGFQNADDAVLFVTFLSTYNKKLELCEEDRLVDSTLDDDKS